MRANQPLSKPGRQLAALCVGCGVLLSESAQQHGLCTACAAAPEPSLLTAPVGQPQQPRKRQRPWLKWADDFSNHVLEEFFGWQIPLDCSLEELKAAQQFYASAIVAYLEADAPYGNNRAGMLRYWKERRELAQPSTEAIEATLQALLRRMPPEGSESAL